MEVLLLILKCLFYLVSFLVAFYFILPVLLFVCYILSGGSPKRNPVFRYKKKNDREYDFAAIITAHQDTRFIAPLVDSFMKQKYTRFKVYLVADDCDTGHMHFSDERVVLLSPPQPLHSKIRSIQYAIRNFRNEPDALIIFDSDNLVHPGYLEKLNLYFQRGFKVVQTHMLSKNTDNKYARLDTLGHTYYNFYERIIKMQLGFSSAILGLGVAIDFNLYKEIDYQNTVGGYDKKLQSQLARKVRQIAFAEDAVVYDEKVEDPAVLQKQRTRWIYSYFDHFKEGWLLTKTGILNLNAGQILLGTSMLRPPLIFLVLAMLVLVALSFIISPVLVYWWAGIVLLFLINFILTIATQSRQTGMLGSVKHLPLLLFHQFKSILKIKKAKREFLKTEHKRVIYIDDLLKNEHF